MKMTIFSLFLLVNFVFGALITNNTEQVNYSGKSIEEIKKEATEIKGEVSSDKYSQNVDQFKKIRDILNLNVLEYYDLDYEYDSDLKKKHFKKTDEYDKKYEALKNKREQLTSETYFLDFQPDYFASKYNLETKSFSFSTKCYKSYYFGDHPQLVQFDDILFNIPSTIEVKKEIERAGGVTFVDQSLLCKIEGEKLALEIEENRKKLNLLFVFKFTSTKEHAHDSGIVSYDFTTTLKDIIMYNSATNEIYKSYM
jgi:hypothetical protein